jgi:Hsp70 protein
MASLADRQRANATPKDGQFLIYDLGGGTFDVAIVQSVGGTVNIVGHGGVNMLGGWTAAGAPRPLSAAKCFTSPRLDDARASGCRFPGVSLRAAT